MKNKLNTKNKIVLIAGMVLAIFSAPFATFAYSSGSASSYYFPTTSSSGSASSYYTPSSSYSSGSASSYYYPSSSYSSGSASSYYYPSSSYSSGSASSYYYPTRSTVNSYLPSTCSGRSCSGSTAGTYRYGGNTGGYTYGSTGGYNYLPTGGSTGGMLGGALGLNYSDNDTTITDNSDNSVRIRTNIRNSSTTITNTCSNGNNASSSGNCNTVNNYVVARDDEDEDDELEVICRVSDTSVEEGDTVTFEVEIDGGRRDYRIEWDGDISGDDDEERVRFNRSGTYRVSVEVRDANGDRDSDDCAVVRVEDEDEDDDDDDNRVVVTTNSNLGTPNGNLAALDSVFLSQVPYTGPGDVARALGIFALIAVWSTAVAMYLKKQRTIKSVSNKIAEFKNRNKEANKIA